MAVIEAILGIRPHREPPNWGSLFIAFGQHGMDHSRQRLACRCHYGSALWPTRGAKTFALLGDVNVRSGGTLLVSGSHRLVHEWFWRNPPPADARSADMRRLLRSHPYVGDLHIPGPVHERIERFMGHVEDAAGIPLQVVEMTGTAGDMILLHPLVLHVAAANEGVTSRFLLSGGITTDMWGWGATGFD